MRMSADFTETSDLRGTLALAGWWVSAFLSAIILSLLAFHRDPLGIDLL